MPQGSELFQTNIPVPWLHELAKADCVKIAESLGLELKGTEHFDQV